MGFYNLRFQFKWSLRRAALWLAKSATISGFFFIFFFFFFFFFLLRRAPWFWERTDRTLPTSPCVSSPPEPAPQHREPKVRLKIKLHGAPDLECSEGLQKCLFNSRTSDILWYFKKWKKYRVLGKRLQLRNRLPSHSGVNAVISFAAKNSLWSKIYQTLQNSKTFAHSGSLGRPIYF